MTILNYFYIFFLTLLVEKSAQSEQWITYNENENFLISYKLKRCNDIKNGFDFNVYLIKLTNKTGKTLVVDFVLGDPLNPRQREEDKVIVILGKRESKEGTCWGYDNLSLTHSSNMTQKKSIPKEFKLSSINFVEIK
ncbi:MAG: hypothetical protein CMC44_02465 [Flavobacteriaceae bacterium]|nr:hypothetical protein [Flavobacteriaceae bacterium]|tara:strand:- start:2908 stop:3318 length:411 start_codon:yes stop_codon:yes gene_type:complete